MFQLYANKNKLTVRQGEPVTSGSVNVYTVRFQFSKEWDGLSRTAVFRAGTESWAVRLGDDNEAGIPWEVLKRPNLELFCGVYGSSGGTTVLPTVWASLGTILPGVSLGEPSRPPAPEVWRQELERKGDGLSYTMDGELGLFSGERLLSSVPVAGGGEGGVSDHRLLAGRDAAEQHPLEAISGLKRELARIPAPVEPLTNEELEEILK